MNRELDYSYFDLSPVCIKNQGKAYIENGNLPGPFLQAVICNKLKEAFEEADKINISDIFICVCFFRNEAPVGCWGSEARMANWIKYGGLEGRRKLEDVP